MGAFVLVTAGRLESWGWIDASQVFEKLLLLQLSEGYWPHGSDGVEGEGPLPNDVILLCLAAEDGLEIVGDAPVAERSVPLTPARLGQVRMYLGPALPPEPDAFTHGVVLTELSIWDRPWVCRDRGGPAATEIEAALKGRKRTGVLRAISWQAFETITGRRAPEMTHEAASLKLPTQGTASDHRGTCGARDFVAANWELVDFGEHLALLDGTERSMDVRTPAGAIDLLCTAGDSGDLVAVMWANGEAPPDLLAAAQARLSWLRERWPGRRVRGLIVTLGERRDLPLATEDHLEVRRLRIVCEPILPTRPTPPQPGEQALGAVSPSSRPPTDPDFAAKCLRVPRAARP